MKLGSFWHKDHSCIIFHSIVMITCRLLYWTFEIQNSILAFQSLILLTCQWYKNKTICENKPFHPCLHNTERWVLQNMCQRSSGTITMNLTKFWPCCTSVNIISKNVWWHPPHLLTLSRKRHFGPILVTLLPALLNICEPTSNTWYWPLYSVQFWTLEKIRFSKPKLCEKTC